MKQEDIKPESSCPPSSLVKNGSMGEESNAYELSQGFSGFKSESEPFTIEVKEEKWPVMQKPDHDLSLEQQEVLNLVLQGNNVFFTGSAGTGKSLVLLHIKYQLNQRRKKFAVTAPTGSASILIGGQTLHSWAGVGIADKPVGAYITMAKNGYGGVGKRRFDWRKTDVLIIDEISMVIVTILQTSRR